MKDYKKLSKEEKRKISDYIQKMHKSYVKKSPDFKEDVSSFMNNFHRQLVKWFDERFCCS